MWIFTSSAFLSVVDKGGDGSTLLVRGRREGEIEGVFPGAKVEYTPRNDYRFRARVNREEVAQVMAEMIRNIRYDNFKATVTDGDRHDTYMGVWEDLYQYQARHK